MSLSYLIRASVLSTAISLGSTAMAQNIAGPYDVEINTTEIIRLSEPAASIVIGNPKIADISVHSSDSLFLLGRGYGKTNVLVLNSNGDTILDADIQVTAPMSRGSVRVYAGGARKSYYCAPYCLPSPILGDSPAFVGLNTAKSAAIANTQVARAGESDSSTVDMAVATEPTPIEEEFSKLFKPENLKSNDEN